MPINEKPNWRDDTTGDLRGAVETFLGGEAMTARDIALVRIFLRRSIGTLQAGGSMIDVLQTQVDDITTRADIERWLDRAAGEGIDPL
jgi:hypothetical protein